MQDLLKELNKSFGENKVIKVGDGVHVKIETTMHYALVNQSNVKISHRRYIA